MYMFYMIFLYILVKLSRKRGFNPSRGFCSMGFRGDTTIDNPPNNFGIMVEPTHGLLERPRQK